jgi:hypothetical protein
MIVDEKTDFREIAREGGTVISYRAGDFTFREGDTAGFMYIVLKGSVEMSTKDKVVVTIPERTPGFVWYVINEFAARLRATNALL